MQRPQTQSQCNLNNEEAIAPKLIMLFEICCLIQEDMMLVLTMIDLVLLVLPLDLPPMSM